VVSPRVGGSHGDIASALSLAVFEHDRAGIRLGYTELGLLKPAEPDPSSVAAVVADLLSSEGGFANLILPLSCDPDCFQTRMNVPW